MKTKIYFRVDALSNKGTGHLVRSLALAKMLEEYFTCIFISKIDHPSIVEIITSSGFKYIPVSSRLDRESELLWLSNYFNGNEILVLDGYHFDEVYQLEVKKIIGKLVCIDDIHSTHFFADAIINHSGGIKKDSYSTSEYTQLFLGLDYLLLRPNFFNAKKSIRKSEIEHMMICLGGEDPNNNVFDVLSKCGDIQGLKTCSIVVGGAYKHREDLIKFCKKSALNIQILSQLSAKEMVGLMSQCDTAVCSPSTVSLEYLAVGGNLFLYQIADNQKNVIKFLLDEQLAFSFDNIQEVSAEQLSCALVRQNNLIDGQSKNRLLKIFTDLEKAMNVNIREACFNDMYQYFLWVNDTETRQQSFDSKPIPFSDHYSWFWDKLNSDKCYLLVLEFNNKSVGQIRFQIKDNIATISYSIDEKFRGKGFGKILLRKGIDFIKEKENEIFVIEGYVKKENNPSVYTFKKLGFKEFNEDNNQLKFQQATY